VIFSPAYTRTSKLDFYHLIPIIGVMDLVEEDADGTIIITENKTSGRAYTNNQIDKNLQLIVYQIAAKTNGLSNRDNDQAYLVRPAFSRFR
jgi:hypothetical protein